MVLCDSCGADVQESSFCSECGATLVRSSYKVDGGIHPNPSSQSDASYMPVRTDSASSLYSGEVPSQVGSGTLTHLNIDALPDASSQIVFAVTLLISEIIFCCCGGGLAAIFSGIALYFARRAEDSTEKDTSQEMLAKAKIFNIVSLAIFVFCLLAAVAAMFFALLLK